MVAGLVMAILAYMLLSSISGLINKFNFLVHHGTPVLINAQQLTGEMVNMETGLRGYLVTGDVGFLDPYFFGIDAFNKTMVEEQELTNDNQAAVAKLKEIHEMEQEWLSGYAEPAFELREKIEAGATAVAQANFAEISARTIGKEKFDGIRAVLGGITARKSPRPMAGGLFVQLELLGWYYYRSITFIVPASGSYWKRVTR